MTPSTPAQRAAYARHRARDYQRRNPNDPLCPGEIDIIVGAAIDAGDDWHGIQERLRRARDAACSDAREDGAA